MEVYAGFSEYTDAQVGRIIDYLEKSGQLENTVVIYAADNGASGEGSPNGSVNENKFFNGYPDELSENMKLIDGLGGPDTYEHYPDRLGGGDLDAVQDVQALLRIRRRHLRSAGDLLAEGHQGARRGAQPVPPLHRHRPDDPRRLRPGDAEGVPRRRAVSALRRVDALHVRASQTAPTQKKRQYYAMLGTRGNVGGRLEGGRRCSPDLRQGAFRQGRVGALPRRRRSAPSRRTWPRSIPRSCRR